MYSHHNQSTRYPATESQRMGLGGSRFEFRFCDPYSIPKAVKRHNDLRTAELAEKGLLRSAKSIAPIFCKIRNPGRDVHGTFTSRDKDVETMISLNSSGSDKADELEEDTESTKCPRNSSHDTSETAFFSANGMDGDDEAGQKGEAWDKQRKRLRAGCDFDSHCHAQARRSSRLKKKPEIRKCRQAVDPNVPSSERLEALHREVCAELESLKSLASFREYEALAKTIHPPPSAYKQSGMRRIKVQKSIPELPPSKPKVPPRYLMMLPSKQKKSRAKDPAGADDLLQRPKGYMRGATDGDSGHLLQRPKGSLRGTTDGNAGRGDGGSKKPFIQKAIKVEYREPVASFVDLIPSAMMSQAIEVNVCQAVNASKRAATQFMNQHRSVKPEPTLPFFREDSDLDNEYNDRKGYLSQLESRPSRNSSQTEIKPLVEEGQNKPIFFEMERSPNHVSLLRSLSPLHYTSQLSEDTVRGQTSQETLASLGRRHALQRPKSLKRLLKRSPKMAHKMCAARRRPMSESDESDDDDDELPPKDRVHSRQPGGGDKLNLRRQPGVQDRAILGQQSSGRQKHEKNLSTPSPKANITPAPAPAPASDSAPQPSTTAGSLSVKRRKSRPVVFSQSLEDLKYEKLSIYNKISMTQERIISALDRLQYSLLQLHVPACNTMERRKRERNAFEFCVRFSRNFLYPLKGMIDDVRRTPVAFFNSATSNEACQRVVCVYGLMHQSITTYQRQLRYFLLEKVPQKLSALMEMLYTLSNTCVEKGILDRHDPVVECLLERSSTFLTFIEDMQEERFMMAREHYRRTQKQKQNHAAQGKTQTFHAKPPAPHSSCPEKTTKQNYDLKMCLNAHKLYEPRLVPKKKPQDLKRSQDLKRPRPVRPKAIVPTAHQPGSLKSYTRNQSALLLVKPGLEDVKTQVELDDIPYSQWLGLRTPKSKDADQKLQMPQKPQKQQMPQKTQKPQKSRKPQKTGSPIEHNEEELQQALLDALCHVSRDQVYQVLDPLMRSLGALLDDTIPKH